LTRPLGACFGEPGGRATRSNPMSLAAVPPGSPGKLLLAREREPARSASRSKVTSLGWGDGRLEGDMGLSPLASRHPTRATNPRRIRPLNRT
jgi:hypothetical protein